MRIRKTLSLPGECSSRLIASANDTAGSLLPGECSSRLASGVRQKEAAGGVEEEGAGEEGADGLDERVEEDKQAEREKPMLEGDGLQVLQVLQMEEDDEDLRDGAVWGRWGWEGHTGVTGGMSCASETARPRPTRRLETSSVLKGGEQRGAALAAPPQESSGTRSVAQALLSLSSHPQCRRATFAAAACDDRCGGKGDVRWVSRALTLPLLQGRALRTLNANSLSPQPMQGLASLSPTLSL